MDHMHDDPATHGTDKLADLIKDIRFGMFTTHKPNHGHLHSRPMTTQNRHIEDGSLWFFMSRSGDPVAEFEGDDQVNVSYADPGSDTYVSVSGVAEIVDDRAKKLALWNKGAEAWFKGGVNDPDLALVQVRIDIGSLWAYRHGEPLHISDVRVEDGLLVMLRTRGKLTTLPALRETSRAKSQAMAASQATAAGAGDAPAANDDVAAASLVVEHAHVAGVTVDLYDATLPGGAMHRVRFEQVQGAIDGIALPALMAPIGVDLRGRLKGVEHDGTVSIKGTLTPARHDADLAFRLVDVDLVALQPYLMRFGERPVTHGSLDLSLDAHVVDRRVEAPGQLTLRGLEFGASDAGGMGTFAGVERRAVLAALQKNGRIDLKFTLEGRTDDPKFSLDEKLGIRVAAVLGETVGLSVKGVVEGVGDVFKGLFNGAKADKGAR